MQMESSSKTNILVMGAFGYLGTHLIKDLRLSGSYNVFTHSHTQPADFSNALYDLNEVESLLLKNKFDFCINLLAVTDVDYCEKNYNEALKFNYTPVKNIVSVINKHQLSLKLIHISTDHVYNADHSSEDQVELVNSYATTKFLADKEATCAQSVVLRTNFFGPSASAKRSFTDWIDQAYAKGETISGFTDIYFSPVHFGTLISVIELVMASFQPGVYNVGSTNGFSKYDFIKKYFELKKYDLTQLKTAQYSNIPSKIKRPLDMRMNVSKLENTYGIRMRSLQEEILKIFAP